MKRIFVCTGNEGKLREFRSVLENQSCEVIGLNGLNEISGIDFKEPKEDGETFFSNALIKMKEAHSYLWEVSKKIKKETWEVADAILVDDSGLCVKDFGGEPGVHSAYYAGLPRDDGKNRKRLKQCLIEQNLGQSDASFLCLLLTLIVPKISNSGVPTTQFLSDKHRFGSLESVSSDFFYDPQSPVSFFETVEMNSHQLHLSTGFCRGVVKPEEQTWLTNEGHGYDSMFYAPEFEGRSFASVTLAEKNKLSHRGRALSALIKHLKIT
jgi:XTP/dITP diphosphohydrolase